MIKSIFTIEKMVFGTCIENPRAWKFLFQHLSEENFIDVKNRAIIHAAHALIDEGKCPERHAFLAPAVGVDEKYLDKLVVFACDHTQFVECINMLKNIPEGQLQIDENIQQRADQNPIPQKSSSAVTPVNTPSSTEQCQLIEGATAIDGFFQQLKEQPIPPVATGITALDNLLGGGMINGGLYILAANTGCGKTALALQIADAVANEDRSVLFISLEMDEYQLTARRLARAAKVSANHLIMHDLSEMEYVHIKQQLPMLKQKRLVFNRPGAFTVSDIQALAGQVQNLRLVIIDYLGLLQSEPYYGSRYEATTAISNALKALARLLGVPILCLAQLNRANAQRLDKHPILADLRDSGSIEQDADGVLLLYRPDMYASCPIPTDKEVAVRVECNLAKHRHGATGRTTLALKLSTGEFFTPQSKEELHEPH